MRIIGFLLIVAGWLLVLATLVLLPPGPSQMAFVLVSLAIELAGFVLVARSHIAFRNERLSGGEVE